MIRRIVSIAICSCALLAQSSIAQQADATVLADLSGPHFNIMGFGDISYVSRNGSDPDGFTIGQAVVHVGASLDDSFSVFGEFSLTANESSYSAVVERMIVKYEFSDQLKFSAGRFH